jgi:hypothetical protein
MWTTTYLALIELVDSSQKLYLPFPGWTAAQFRIHELINCLLPQAQKAYVILDFETDGKNKHAIFKGTSPRRFHHQNGGSKPNHSFKGLFLLIEYR